MKSSAFVVKDATAAATAIKPPTKAPKVGKLQLVARETVSMWGNTCTVFDRNAPPPWGPDEVFDLPGFRHILTYPVVFVLKDSGNVTPAAFKKMLTSFIIEGPDVDDSDSEDEAEPEVNVAPDEEDPTMEEDAAADFDGDVSTEAEETEGEEDEDYEEPEPDFS